MSDSTLGSAPAVSRDGFSFHNGQFYVEVDGHRHQRQDAATLYALLTLVAPPPAPGGDGKLSKRPKDREAHFYRAQLLHYGLPPLKTRDPAKKKLLAAYGGANGRTLEPPSSILQLEAALGKEWRDLDAKVGKSSVVVKKEPTPANLKDDKGWYNMDTVKIEKDSTTMKRELSPSILNGDKLVGPSKRMKLTARKGTGGLPPPKLKPTAIPPMRAPTLPILNHHMVTVPRQPRTKQTARKTMGRDLPPIRKQISAMPWAGPSKRTKQTAVKSRIKEQLRQDISGLPAEALRNLLVVLLRDIPEVEGVLLTEIPALSCIGIATSDTNQNTTHLVDPAKWMGVYSIRAPQLEEDWEVDEEYDMILHLSPSSTSAHVWGTFDFGIVSGVMRSPLPPPPRLNTEFLFEWRGRFGGEDSESIMQFSETNSIAVTFMADGKIKGEMGGGSLQTFAFSGDLVTQGPANNLGSVQDWKYEWRGINIDTYEAESEARWGKYRNGRQDSPFDSDTTAGNDDDESNDEEENWDY